MELADLGDLIFDIKDKITDDEFLGIMNQLHKLHRKYERGQNYDHDIDDNYVDNYVEDDYDDEDDNEDDDYYDDDDDDDDDDYDDDDDDVYHYEPLSILGVCPSNTIYNSEYAHIWLDIHRDIKNNRCYCSTESEMRCPANNIICIHYKSMCQTIPGIKSFFSRNNKYSNYQSICLSSECKELDSTEKINKYHFAIFNYLGTIHTGEDQSILILILMSYTMSILPRGRTRLHESILEKLVSCKGPIERHLASFDYRNIINNSIEEISSTIDTWIAHFQA